MTLMLGSVGALLRRKGVLVVLGGLVASGGFVVGSQYAFNLDVPQWEVGDTWKYATTFTMHVDVPQMEGFDGEMEDETESDEVWMRVLQADASIGDVPVYGIAFSDDGLGFDSETFVTKADLNPVMADMEDALACAASYGASAGVAAGPGSYVAPPRCEVDMMEVRLFDFPLYPGKSWTLTPRFATDAVNLTARVGDRDVISIPYGNVVAYKITVSIEEILDADMKRFMEESDTRIGLEYWYAPELEWLGRVRFFAESTEPESGASMRMEFLMEAVEKTRADVGAPGTTPTAIPGASTVEIQPSARIVNAAESEEVVLKAVGTGLPVSASFVWKVGGEKLKGDTVTVAFDEPGRHTVVLEAYDADGRLLAKDKDLIVANYEAVFEERHAAVGSGAWYEIPVHDAPAALALTYRYTETGGLPLPHDASDDMVLYDADGEEMGRGTEIVLTDFSGVELGDLTIAVDLRPGETVMGASIVEVHVIYDAAGGAVWAAPGHEHGSDRGDDIGWGSLFPRLDRLTG